MLGPSGGTSKSRHAPDSCPATTGDEAPRCAIRAPDVGSCWLVWIQSRPRAPFEGGRVRKTGALLHVGLVGAVGVGQQGARPERCP